MRLLRTISEAQQSTSYNDKRRVLHLVCLLKTGGDLGKINTAMAKLPGAGQISPRQFEKATHHSLATPPSQLGIALPQRPSPRRLTWKDKLKRLLRFVLSSNSVVQQTWSTILLDFTNGQTLETACLSRNVSKDEL